MTSNSQHRKMDKDCTQLTASDSKANNLCQAPAYEVIIMLCYHQQISASRYISL